MGLDFVIGLGGVTDVSTVGRNVMCVVFLFLNSRGLWVVTVTVQVGCGVMSVIFLTPGGTVGCYSHSTGWLWRDVCSHIF